MNTLSFLLLIQIHLNLYQFFLANISGKKKMLLLVLTVSQKGIHTNVHTQIICMQHVHVQPTNM